MMTNSLSHQVSGPPETNRLINFIFLLTPVLAIFAPKTLAGVVPVLGALSVGHLASTQDLREVIRRTAPVTVVLTAFFILAATSALWAVNPKDAFYRGSIGVLTVISAHSLFVWCDVNRKLVRRSISWFLFGYIAGLCYLIFEVLSGQIISKLIVSSGLGRDASLFRLNLNVAVATLLLWPALAGLLLRFDAKTGRIMALLVISLAVVVAFSSDHETSKLSLLAAMVTLLAAAYLAQFTRFALQSVWTVATLLIVPLCLIVHQRVKLDVPEFSEHSLLMIGSARHRLIIWGNLSEKVLEDPILGHGTRSIYALNAKEKLHGDGHKALGLNAIPPHAHNIYLQTWFELGAMGALLLGAAGLLLLQATRGLTGSLFPVGAAAAANGMVQIFPSFELWQQWYLAGLALSCVAVCISLKMAEAESLPLRSEPMTSP